MSDAGGHGGVEAGADFSGGVISDDDDADGSHVSLCPTGEQKIQSPIRIPAHGLQMNCSLDFVRTLVISLWILGGEGETGAGLAHFPRSQASAVP